MVEKIELLFLAHQASSLTKRLLAAANSNTMHNAQKVSTAIYNEWKRLCLETDKERSQ